MSINSGVTIGNPGTSEPLKIVYEKEKYYDDYNDRQVLARGGEYTLAEMVLMGNKGLSGQWTIEAFNPAGSGLKDTSFGIDVHLDYTIAGSIGFYYEEEYQILATGVDTGRTVPELHTSIGGYQREGCDLQKSNIKKAQIPTRLKVPAGESGEPEPVYLLQVKINVTNQNTVKGCSPLWGFKSKFVIG